MVSEQVTTATVFLGENASSSHRKADAACCYGSFKKKKKIYSRNDRHLLNVFKGCFKWDFDDANIAVRKQRPSYIFSTDVTDL